jgi:hypothetical protein
MGAVKRAAMVTWRLRRKTCGTYDRDSFGSAGEKGRFDDDEPP